MIVLEARVPVSCHVIYAEVAVASDMPYMMPVLEHVRGRGGAATESSLSKELFLSMPLCRSLLAHCAGNGLVENTGGERHAVTPDGILALESGRAFIRKTGMWKVHLADHKAIPEDMRLVRIEDGAWDAGYRPEKGPGQPGAEVLDAPILDRLGNKALRPPLGRIRGAIVRSVHHFGKRIEADMDLTLRVELGRDGSKVTLLASPRGGPRPGRPTTGPEEASLPSIGTTIDGAMKSILRGGGEGDWDAERGRMLVDYDGASDEELSSMRKTVCVERPVIGGMKFERATATAEILPRREADAGRWARRLFAFMAAAYVTREEYERLVGDIRSRFPGFDIDMGDRAGHVPGEGSASGTRGRPRLFWLIQAMEDWDL